MKTSPFSLTLHLLVFLIASPWAGAAPTDRQPPQSYHIVIADGLAPAIRTNLFLEIIGLVRSAPPGSRLVVWQTPERQRLADARVPAGKSNRRLNLLASQSRPLREALFTAARPCGPLSEQLELPSVLDDIARVHDGATPLRIVVAGTPLFASRFHGEAAFAMTNGLVPGDLLVLGSRAACPLGTAERRNQLSGAALSWVAPGAWAESSAHEQMVIRLWNLFLKAQGCTLTVIGPDPRAAFEAAFQTNPTSLGPVTAIPEMAQAAMLRLRDTVPGVITFGPPAVIPVLEVDPRPILKSNAGLEVQPAAVTVEQVLETVPTNEIAVAAIWKGKPNTDLDIWLTPQSTTPAEEVFFERPQTSRARLLRDVRSPNSQTDAFGEGWFDRCEVCVVNHTRLQDVVVWLNVYAGEAEITGKVLVRWQGRNVERPFRFQNVMGDRAAQHDQRERSPAWQQIHLREFFPHAFIDMASRP